MAQVRGDGGFHQGSVVWVGTSGRNVSVRSIQRASVTGGGGCGDSITGSDAG